MDANRFLKIVTNPDAWLEKSAALRRSADVLWDKIVPTTVEAAKAEKGNRKTEADAKWNEASEYLLSAQMFYGLALETALKAHLLRTDPKEIELQMSADGTGTLQSIEVKQFGVPIREGHDLIKLANKANLFSRGEDAIFVHESDFQALHEILLHLSDVVRWNARYPAPNKSGTEHVKSPDLPAKIYEHYIRDWIDPVLDKLHSKPPQIQAE